jgi:hypothetical protein
MVIARESCEDRGKRLSVGEGKYSGYGRLYDRLPSLLV